MGYMLFGRLILDWVVQQEGYRKISFTISWRHFGIHCD